MGFGKDFFRLGEGVGSLFDGAHASGGLGASRKRAGRESSGSRKGQSGNSKGELHLLGRDSSLDLVVGSLLEKCITDIMLPTLNQVIGVIVFRSVFKIFSPSSLKFFAIKSFLLITFNGDFTTRKKISDDNNFYSVLHKI